MIEKLSIYTILGCRHDLDMWQETRDKINEIIEAVNKLIEDTVKTGESYIMREDKPTIKTTTPDNGRLGV